MIQFLDYKGNKVELAFTLEAFEEEIKHVLVICQYNHDWYLTKHKQRGLEFPGGKVEVGETLEQAARRETYEETGAILGELSFILAYKVSDHVGSFVKAVFFGKVERVEETNSYFETKGPVVFKGNLLQERFKDEYSFIMKDQVIEECMKYLKDNKKE
ncbi:RNA deprotection pyrophosphohydrolase [Neobacillus jeddahensis]|uniref:RNA deprotection pyrophosphohydrolase n=1 Tax=Neobacillus jeddahensis TaxID=1461580 RepID=UPI000590DF07|nr:nucleoside triphosphatase YtkD [Neobacillus jeddahensis]